MTGYDNRAGKFDIIAVRNADMAFTVTATSGGSAVNLSTATITGELYTATGTVAVTMTDAVSGTGSNIITLSLTDTQTALLLEQQYPWTLWVTRGLNDKRPWLAGRVRVVDSSNGVAATNGSAITLTVDDDVNVAIDVQVLGTGGSLDDLSDVTLTNPVTGNALVYNGSAWANAVPAGGGDMLKIENLSGLADTSTARSNLGVAIGSQVQAYDADLADIAAISDVQGDVIVRGASGWERLAKSSTATDVLTAGATQPGWAAPTGTNLSWTASTSVVASDTGTDATLTAVDGSNPGLMTVAMLTKLNGIEAAADVTDATNVAAAGAVMEGDTSTASMSFVIDEDNMVTDSATKVPTQQSTKAYADLKVPKATFPGSVTVALSDMTTQITTGQTKAYWVNPFDATLTITKVKATLATAGSGATVVDINEGSGTGTSILSTKITIEASETDSDDATTQPVISDTSIAADGRLTFDIDTAGTSAAGLQVTILFTRAV